MTDARTHVNPPQRDMRESAFAEILSRLVTRCPHLLAAVFFDKEGETIDYHSFLDPYSTRLIAAHMGIVFGSAAFRLQWLGIGKLCSAEICTKTHDIVILPVADDFFLTVVMGRGALDATTVEALEEAVGELGLEAGL